MNEQTIEIRQFNRQVKEGIVCVEKADVAVGLVLGILIQLLVFAHVDELTRGLRDKQFPGGFTPFKLRLIMVEGDPNTVDEEGIDRLADFLASHFTAGMARELIVRLLHG